MYKDNAFGYNAQNCIDCSDLYPASSLESPSSKQHSENNTDTVQVFHNPFPDSSPLLLHLFSATALSSPYDREVTKGTVHLM